VAALAKDDREAARLYSSPRTREINAKPISGLATGPALAVFRRRHRGRALFKLAADQGNAAAQANLGFFYANGRGAWRRTIARLHASTSSPRSGKRGRGRQSRVLYASGRGGLEKTIASARASISSPADQGLAQAQANLASLYEQGRGSLPKDDDEAARLYKLAADQGNVTVRMVSKLAHAGMDGVQDTTSIAALEPLFGASATVSTADNALSASRN